MLKQVRVIDIVEQGESTTTVRNDMITFDRGRVKCMMINYFLNLMRVDLGSKIVVIKYKCMILAV